jgi:hypothetical protein
VTRPLRRDHPDVDALGRADLAEVDVEAVRERERVALLEVGLDVLAVHPGLLGVGQQHHDDVGFLHRLGGGEHAQPGLFGLGPRARTLAQPHPHVDTGVGEVAGVRVALGAIAEHRDLAPLEEGEVGVGVVVDGRGHTKSSSSNVLASRFPALTGKVTPKRAWKG